MPVVLPVESVTDCDVLIPVELLQVTELGDAVMVVVLPPPPPPPLDHVTVIVAVPADAGEVAVNVTVAVAEPV
jgi:hypothetical protein